LLKRGKSVALSLALLATGADHAAAQLDFSFFARHRRPARHRAPHAPPPARDLPVPPTRSPIEPPAAAPAPVAPQETAPKDGPPREATPKVVAPPEVPAKMPAAPEPPAKPAETAPGLPVPPEAPARPPLAPEAPAAPAPRVAAPGPARQPATDAGCLDRLKTTAVTAAPISIGTQPDARCTVVDAVKLTGLKLADGSDVAFPDGPTLACVTADTFAAYVRELLSPLAKGSYGAPIAKVWTGPGLECRSRDHIVGAKLSAHGQGLAVDIGQMALTDGRTIAVGVPKSDADRAFETAARAAGCGYFHTTLGPGADAYHKTHWHFDLEPRGSNGDGKFCQ
jgi:hypothetical protein